MGIDRSKILTFNTILNSHLPQRQWRPPHLDPQSPPLNPNSKTLALIATPSPSLCNRTNDVATFISTPATVAMTKPEQSTFRSSCRIPLTSSTPKTLPRRFRVRLVFYFYFWIYGYFAFKDVDFCWFRLIEFPLLISGPLTSAQLSSLASAGPRLRVAYQVLLPSSKILCT